MAKLTLSIDRETIDKAKDIARAGGTSVSAMFSNFILSLDVGKHGPKRIGPLTRKASGIAKLPPGKDYKELLTDALADKYGTVE